MAQHITTLRCRIHAQVEARDGWRRATVQGNNWFQIAVDRATDTHEGRVSEKIIHSRIRTGGFTPVDEQESEVL